MGVKPTIRDVSAGARNILAARAKRERPFLTRYVADVLDRGARRPTMGEVLDRIASRRRLPGGSEQVVEAVRER
ncbi:hypothetical protein ACIBCA_12610 [Kitasatospora sp. NPDC051170]|uniref:hypothetical protein n=1 Tax=Kitasatospora sp. NPDC051170 TaxID=3364056 RepID=UPI0037B8C156